MPRHFWGGPFISRQVFLLAMAISIVPAAGPGKDGRNDSGFLSCSLQLSELS
jgi:hypothetical protein